MHRTFCRQHLFYNRKRFKVLPKPSTVNMRFHPPAFWNRSTNPNKIANIHNFFETTLYIVFSSSVEIISRNIDLNPPSASFNSATSSHDAFSHQSTC
jgi:hypothetical protein